MSNHDLLFNVIAKTDQLQDSLAQMNSAINASMNGLKTQMEGASKGSESVAQKLAKGVGEASKEISKSFDEAGMKASGAAQVIGGSLSAIPNPYAQAAGALISTTDGVKNSLLDLGRAADKSRMGAVAFVELKDALQAAQIPTEHLPEQLATLSEAIGQTAHGSGAAKAAFQQLGISTEGWKNKIPSAKEVLIELAGQMRAGHVTTKDLAAAQTLLGGSFRELLPFLSQGSAAVREQMQAHHENAVAVKSGIDSATQFQHAEDALSEKLQTLLLPAFSAVVRVIEALAVAIMAVKRAWESQFDALLGGTLFLIHLYQGLGLVIDDVMHYKYALAVEHAKEATASLASDVKHTIADIKNDWSGYGDEVKDIFADPKLMKPPTAGLSDAVSKETQKQTAIIELAAQKSVIDHRSADEQIVSDAAAILGQLPRVQQAVDMNMLALLTQYSSKARIVFGKSTAEMEQEEKQSLDRRRQQWGQFFQTVNGAFAGFAKSLLSGHQTLGQAWARMVDDMASKFLSSLEKQLAGFVQKKLTEVAIHVQAEATKDAASQAAHAKEGTRTAYSAAQHAYDSVVDTPIIGPVVAPLAAAGAFAAVAALGSAAGGQWEVPGVQMTMLHPREMVLPARLAQGVRDVVEGGGRNGAVVYSPTLSINAVDGASVARIYNSHIKPMMQRDILKFLTARGLVTA